MSFPSCDAHVIISRNVSAHSAMCRLCRPPTKQHHLPFKQGAQLFGKHSKYPQTLRWLLARGLKSRQPKMQISIKDASKGKDDWKVTAKVHSQMTGPRSGAEEGNSKVEKNSGEEIEEWKCGYSKSSCLCWHAANPWTEMQLAALRLLTTSSSERSLCINQIFILQNQHLYNQYNKCVSAQWPDSIERCVTTQRGANNYLRSKQRVSSAGLLSQQMIDLRRS